MGTAALGQCWPTAADAAQAVCAHAFPVADASGVMVCTGVTGAVMSLEYRTAASAAPLSVTYSGPSCDASEFAAAPFFVSPLDAATLAAAVVGVWGLGFAWRAIRNALSDRDLG